MSINESQYRYNLESLLNVLKIMIEQHKTTPGADGTGSITIHHSGTVELTIGTEYGEMAHYPQFAKDMGAAMEKHYDEGGV